MYRKVKRGSPSSSLVPSILKIDDPPDPKHADRLPSDNRNEYLRTIEQDLRISSVQDQQGHEGHHGQNREHDSLHPTFAGARPDFAEQANSLANHLGEVFEDLDWISARVPLYEHRYDE